MLGCQPKHLAGASRVGAASLRVALDAILLFEDDPRLIAGELVDLLGEVEDGHFLLRADIDRVVEVAHQQAVNAFDQIVDELETARLRSVAIDGQRLTAQRLTDEIRHHAPIVEAHSRSIGVEDADDARIQPCAR